MGACPLIYLMMFRLDRLNEHVVRLPELAVLNASYNSLNFISDKFFLTALRVLNIGFNKLEKLEPAIGYCAVFIVRTYAMKNGLKQIRPITC